MGFPDGSVDKEASCNARDTGDVSLIPESGRSPGGEKGNPLQYSCLEKSMNRGTWQVTVGPWGCKELDTTEHTAYTHTHTHTHTHLYTHTYIHSFLYSFPLWFIPGDLIRFPVLYSRTLLCIHSKCKCLHLLTPKSQSISHPLLSHLAKNLFSMSISLFLFRI